MLIVKWGVSTGAVQNLVIVVRDNARAGWEARCTGPLRNSRAAAIACWKDLPGILTETGTTPSDGWWIEGVVSGMTFEERQRVAGVISTLVTIPSEAWHTIEEVERVRDGRPPAASLDVRAEAEGAASIDPAVTAARRKLAEVAMDASVDDLRARIDAIVIAERRAKIAYHLEQIEALKAEDAAATTPGGTDAG
jgi:hypothetical protein